MTGGTYQVGFSDYRMVILNTETGVLKSYYTNGSTGEWTEGLYINNQNIGSGNLTVNH